MADPDGLETCETQGILGDGAQHVNRAGMIFGARSAKVQKIGELRLLFYRELLIWFDNKSLKEWLRFA
jgi:hypothetical protein